MSQETPQFQEASRCDVCKCSFNTFRRRHHCRCCGRTLCAEHSSNQMALPQYGINTPVRVCSDCFNDDSRSGKEDSSAFLNGVAIVTDSVSRLDINTVSDSKVKPIAEQFPALGISDCKCGMPLCICEAPAPSEDAASSKSKPTFTSSAESNPKTKKTDTMVRSRGYTSISKQNSVFNRMSNSGLGNLQIDYEVNGEGIREAIKKGDTAAVKKLLSQGVDANYCDKQGLSLLHVAAVFNQTDIAFALMEAGAMLQCKNLQGETPLDCASATLQYKMKKKIEEAGQLNHIV